MNKVSLNWFIFFWIAFTCLNVYIHGYKPQIDYDKTQAKLNEPVHQNEKMYIDLQMKLKNESCQSSTDAENNIFYSCKDGTKVSMIKWTRGAERKGVVTREYNPQGKLVQIYGHPDDVY